MASDGFSSPGRDEASSGLDADVILPARVEEITRILDGSAEVKVALGEVRFRWPPHYRMNVKLMEGVFPDYNRIIPSNLALEVTMAASELQEAVARVAVLADPGSNNRIDLFLDGDQAVITAEGAYGGARETVPLKDSTDGGQLALSFNAAMCWRQSNRCR